MSAPNVSDGAVPEWAVKAANLFLCTRSRNVSRQFEQLAAIIARHCPVGCAANEVGAGEALTFWKEHYERQKARITELEAEVAREKQRADQEEIAATTYAKTIHDLRAQLAAAESRCIGLRGLLTNEQEALKRCCKDLAATPAPTAPVGDGALVAVAEGVLIALQYPRGSEAQVRCLEEVGQDAKRALTVPTGSVKEGTTNRE